MAKTCIKCGYTRRDFDTAPDYACPQCGVVYAKAEAAHAQLAVEKAKASALATARAEAIERIRAREATAPGPVEPDASRAAPPPATRADALIRQMMLAQAAQPKRAYPLRGAALVALVAFSVGFASAAGLYSGLNRLGGKAAANAAACVKS